MKMQKNSGFSLVKFMLVIILLSWPFQIAYYFLGESFRFLLLLSMIMVAVGTFISAKYIFNDDFKYAGWSIGKPKHYVFTFLLTLIIWLVPTIIEHVTGLHTGYNGIRTTTILYEFIISFFITLIPAFSEEFGWRGYLLPKLVKTYTQKKALLVHGFITWFWHTPVLIIMGVKMGGNTLISILGILLISLIPTIMHAVIFAYIWNVSNSLAVNTFYHAAFDEVRDSLQNTVGFGPLVEIWQMIFITITGLVLLIKAKWNLEKLHETN